MSASTTTKTPVQKKSSATPVTSSAPASGAAVQLKQSLQGRGFDEQSAMLAPPVQMKGGGPSTADVHQAAAEGTQGGGGALPHIGAIQKAFGGHDVSGIKSHTGGAAAKANTAMGAEAYASGDHVAFKGAPDLHTAAHEAAHIVQQKGGVSLAGGVGQSGDRYEQHADQVADAVVAGKSAEPILDKMGGGGAGGGVQKRAVQLKEGDPSGITGGKVTLKDFNGGKDVSNVDKQKANLKESVNQGQTLADMAKSVATGTARSEAEMLAAIAANTMPRYVARVGPKENFSKYSSFGRPNDFIFATEPADLCGLHPAAAMSKVGWTKGDIGGAAEKPIAVCILDTQKAVPGAGGAAATKVGMGKMEWPELKAKALADSKFTAECKKQSMADPGACFDIWSVTPVKGDPKTSDPTLKADCAKLRVIMTNLYGANPLYSGMGATISESGKLGAREVMLTNNGTGFKLTPDNHVLVDTTPGKYTKAEADAL